MFVELVRQIADAQLVRKNIRNRWNRQNCVRHLKASRPGHRFSEGVVFAQKRGRGFPPLRFRANALEIGGSRGSREHRVNSK